MPLGMSAELSEFIRVGMRASIGTVGATAGMRAHATHLLLLTTALRCPPPRCDVSVRLVDDSELSDKGQRPLFDPATPDNSTVHV